MVHLCFCNLKVSRLVLPEIRMWPPTRFAGKSQARRTQRNQNRGYYTSSMPVMICHTIQFYAETPFFGPAIEKEEQQEEMNKSISAWSNRSCTITPPFISYSGIGRFRERAPYVHSKFFESGPVYTQERDTTGACFLDQNL